jgi:transcription-repair coupling factor (superfamily II helicase)
MGLDIPNANTIIVDNAHRFGLAQLHQLRGRVGRSSKQAYCYYLIPDKHIPKHADNRLEALSRHSALGAGYFIAQEDLELRGAGQFLGEKQSGHIEEIGLTLYLSILKDCINQVKGIDDKKKIDFEINLGDKSLIPEQYLPSMTDRLKYYRKISACKNVEDIKKISKDLVDQCGKLPTALNNLLYDAEIALTATEIGISNIYLNRNNFLQFKFIKPISDENFKKFMELMNSNLYEFKLNAQNKINLKLKSNDARQQIKSFINALI